MGRTAAAGEDRGVNGVRAPVGAGSFYPGRSLELGDRVDELLAQTGVLAA